MKIPVSLLVLSMLCLASFPVSGQSVVPIIVLSVSPVEQFVNVTSISAEAAFDCTVFVEGLPLVRYRVNLTAYCEGWEARCDPALFTVTGSATNSFRAIVTVPAGTPSTLQHQVEIWANVSTTGVPLASSAAYALVSVWPVYGVNLRTDTRIVGVDAGKDAVWPFSLDNTGNGRDTFGLTVVNPGSFPGWTITCNRTSVFVDINGTINLKYTIKPPADARNQTVILQMRAYSKNAAFRNLTVEQRMELELSVKGAAPVQNNTKPPDKKNAPGFEAGGLALVLALAALTALRKRK